MAAAKNSEPRKGYNPGDLEFRFNRNKLTLAIDFDAPRGPLGSGAWLRASLWDRRGKPPQLAHASAPLTDCYLRARANELEPAICIRGASFALRDVEYEALRAYLLVEGLVHHVPEPLREPPEMPWGIVRQHAGHRDVLLNDGTWCNEATREIKPTRFETELEGIRMLRMLRSIPADAFVSRLKPPAVAHLVQALTRRSSQCIPSSTSISSDSSPPPAVAESKTPDCVPTERSPRDPPREPPK